MMRAAGALLKMQCATSVTGKATLVKKKCFFKTVVAGSNELSLDTAFIGAVRANRGTAWTTTLLMETRPVSCKFDTGAEVTEQTYLQLGKQKLLKSDKVLYGPVRQTLKVLGKFTMMMKYQQRETQQAIFVVRGLQSNLLGLPAIASLKLHYSELTASA